MPALLGDLMDFNSNSD
jgi:hypothetical protein